MDTTLKKKWSSKPVLDRVLTGLLPVLEAQAYISSENRVADMGGNSRAYITYSLTTKGAQWIRNVCPLMLPVPHAVRLVEEEKQKRIKLVRDELVMDGVDMSRVPAEVMDDENGGGDGTSCRSTFSSNFDLLFLIARLAKMASIY